MQETYIFRDIYMKKHTYEVTNTDAHTYGMDAHGETNTRIDTHMKGYIHGGTYK